MLRDNRVGSSHQCLENPRPAGAELSLTEDVTSPFQAEPTHDVHGLLKRRVARQGSQWVFYSPAGAGRPAHFEKHIGSVRKAHDAAVARAGIVDVFRLYDLRHTYATR